MVILKALKADILLSFYYGLWVWTHYILQFQQCNWAACFIRTSLQVKCPHFSQPATFSVEWSGLFSETEPLIHWCTERWRCNVASTSPTQDLLIERDTSLFFPRFGPFLTLCGFGTILCPFLIILCFVFKCFVSLCKLLEAFLCVVILYVLPESCYI